MLKNRFIKLLLAVMATASLSANAASFDLSGAVTVATGAFAALTPVGTPVTGPIVIDDAAVAAGLAIPADILGIDINVGGFCFSTGMPSACPLGGADVPITSIDSAFLTFAGGAPTGGNLNVTAFSPTFMVSIPIFFDLTAGTFFADGGALGTVAGTAVLSAAPVPVPAAIWFMGSALLGLFGVRRRA